MVTRKITVSPKLYNERLLLNNNYASSKTHLIYTDASMS